jgi:NADH:ubiquinone oxidoreductase subunit 2 (subunit N)
MSINNSLIYIIIILRLILKLDLSPLHFWFPIISIYIDWTRRIILFSIQKIIPFIFISLIYCHLFIYVLIILFIITISPFVISKITNLGKLLVYSSISQTGWILFIIIISSKIWLTCLRYTSSIEHACILFSFSFLWNMKCSPQILHIPKNHTLFRQSYRFNEILIKQSCIDESRALCQHWCNAFVHLLHSK